ncbi:MAG: flavodoxin family protein, partial [Spirochaetaceae bacterium]|nr:flavodoxin family protein [Spirochaetaceae bacterium]
MIEKGLIVYSSRTGNTRKIAEGIARGFTGQGVQVRLVAIEEKPVPGEDEWTLVGFWADRGDADEKAREYLKSLRNRYVGVFGTLGAYPDSDHAREIAKKVEELT